MASFMPGRSAMNTANSASVSSMLKLTIGDGCVLYDEYTCKKL